MRSERKRITFRLFPPARCGRNCARRMWTKTCCALPAIRPVLILQNNVGNRHSPTVIAAPITSKMGKPRLPTHVCLNRQANGLSCGSVILLEQLRTIDKSRLRERVGALDTSEMKQIDWALGVSVGLAEGYR